MFVFIVKEIGIFETIRGQEVNACQVEKNPSQFSVGTYDERRKRYGRKQARNLGKHYRNYTNGPQFTVAA